MNTRTRPSLHRTTSGLVAVVLASMLAVAATTPTVAQDSDETVRTLSVTGIGLVHAAPDVADISVGVTEQAKEAGAASSKAAESMDSVIDALLDMGIDAADIQTTDISLSPRYDWNQDPAPLVGWDAINMVRATIRDSATIGAAVDAATAAGANQVAGISFRIDDPTDAQDAARDAAVADARAKADQLAAAAGVSIIGTISISEGYSSAPQPIYMDRGEMYAGAGDTAAPTPVMPGEVETSVSVSIVYEIA